MAKAAVQTGVCSLEHSPAGQPSHSNESHAGGRAGKACGPGHEQEHHQQVDAQDGLPHQRGAVDVLCLHFGGGPLLGTVV